MAAALIPCLAEALDQAVGAALGPYEDERAATLAVGQLAHERVELVLVGDSQEAVVDHPLGLLGGKLLVDAGVVRVGPGDAPGVALQRGRQEERLAIGGRLGHDPVDGRPEAHVEHAVGLVEDEHAHAIEPNGPAGDQVLEPPGGGDDDVRLAGELALALDADSAVDGGQRQRACARHLGQVLGDLTRQFASRDQNQRGGAGVGRLEALDHRHSERERLARAGRRLDEHVVSVEGVGNDQALDGEGGGDAACCECARDGV